MEPGQVVFVVKGDDVPSIEVRIFARLDGKWPCLAAANCPMGFPCYRPDRIFETIEAAKEHAVALAVLTRGRLKKTISRLGKIIDDLEPVQVTTHSNYIDAGTRRRLEAEGVLKTRKTPK